VKCTPVMESDLRSLVKSAPTLVDSYIALSNVKDGKKYSITEYRSNVESGVAGRIKNVILQMAPVFSRTRYGLAFYKSDLDTDGEPELVIACRERVGDPYDYNGVMIGEDSYLHMFVFRWTGSSYRKDVYGIYLSGEIVAIRPFVDEKKKCIFLKWDSCNYCGATTFLGIVGSCTDYTQPCIYKFDFTKEYDGIHNYIHIEYGEDPEPKVITKIPVPERAKDASVLQEFSYEHLRKSYENNSDRLKQVDDDEYWIFRCKGLDCGAEISKSRMPDGFRAIWEKAKVFEMYHYE
jgi:hypothetical protein